ncbi:hypothetical protein L6452_37378 [Arctium lappa]|uniref:Uncharacterized protein n=1 Tax=Arctium lappa TaxID=4217 RepID=A0ACB8Y3I7_ARCLA|nr:hypothetical protein L6452_37378 [Arctium lappa]
MEKILRLCRLVVVSRVKIGRPRLLLRWRLIQREVGVQEIDESSSTSSPKLFNVSFSPPQSLHANPTRSYLHLLTGNHLRHRQIHHGRCLKSSHFVRLSFHDSA